VAGGGALGGELGALVDGRGLGAAVEDACGREVNPSRSWRSTLISDWPRSASISSKNSTSGSGHFIAHACSAS
jgi:hypothetical protein